MIILELKKLQLLADIQVIIQSKTSRHLYSTAMISTGQMKLNVLEQKNQSSTVNRIAWVKKIVEHMNISVSTVLMTEI